RRPYVDQLAQLPEPIRASTLSAENGNVGKTSTSLDLRRVTDYVLETGIWKDDGCWPPSVNGAGPNQLQVQRRTNRNNHLHLPLHNGQRDHTRDGQAWSKRSGTDVEPLRSTSWRAAANGRPARWRPQPDDSRTAGSTTPAAGSFSQMADGNFARNLQGRKEEVQ